MADVNRGNRPLSPHLTIYRFHILMVTSILVRITGVGMFAGALAVVWWLLAASVGPDYFAFADGLITSLLGDLFMAGLLLAMWYHLLTGVRHLIWDQIIWIDLQSAERLGWAVVIGAFVLTALTLVLI